jgi:DNA-binding FrmR family transcriptional regulator
VENRRNHKKTRLIINRLSRIEGHIAAIKRMLEEDRTCPEILVQLAAVRGGIEKAAKLVLEDHVESCVRAAVEEGALEASWDELADALDSFFS